MQQAMIKLILHRNSQDLPVCTTR